MSRRATRSICRTSTLRLTMRLLTLAMLVALLVTLISVEVARFGHHVAMELGATRNRSRTKTQRCGESRSMLKSPVKTIPRSGRHTASGGSGAQPT